MSSLHSLIVSWSIPLDKKSSEKKLSTLLLHFIQHKTTTKKIPILSQDSSRRKKHSRNSKTFTLNSIPSISTSLILVINFGEKNFLPLRCLCLECMWHVYSIPKGDVLAGSVASVWKCVGANVFHPKKRRRSLFDISTTKLMSLLTSLIRN